MILSETLAARAAAAGEFVSPEARRLWDAAEKLEALFVTQLVKASRMISAGAGGERAGGAVYQGLAEESFGEALARSSDFGIASELIRSLGASAASAPPHTPASAAQSPAPESVQRRDSDPTIESSPVDRLGRRHPMGAVLHKARIGKRLEDGTHRVPTPEPPRRVDRIVERLAPFSEAVADASSRYGVDPSVISAIIAAESGGDARAVSPKGARGLMQIVPGTARELGLANPFDPRENILAGTRYLARMLDRFGGDLALALAAYNAGPGAVARHGGIPPYRETIRYVADVLSLAGDLELKGAGE